MKLALALALLPFTFCSLAACGGKVGPEDPALAVGTGIPVGAPNATGARFDAPPSRGTPIDDGTIEQGPTPLPKAVPDPFDPKDKAHGPTAPLPPAPSVNPKPVKPPKKGVQL